MIVRDEAALLPRALDSCRELIDHWVICDTGSVDGTPELIRRALEGIPGELHEHPWEGFAANRTRLLEAAFDRADYLLLLDADQELVLSPPLPELTADAYLIPASQPGTGAVWLVKALISGRRRWRYVGVTHEYLECLDGAERVEQTDRLGLLDHGHGRDRSAKAEAELAALTAALVQDPEDRRAQFYLAQTCFDLGVARASTAMLENALEHYQRRAEMGGWAEEVYWSLYQCGQVAERLGDWPGAMDFYMQAWELRPVRLEAVHRLTAGLRERSLHQAAHRFARMAANLRPLQMPEDLLFLSPWIYEWGMLFEYSITAYWLGEYANSASACRKLLTLASLPEAYREQTRANLQHAVREDARARSKPRPARAARRIQHVGTPTRGKRAYADEAAGGPRPGAPSAATVARAAELLETTPEALAQTLAGESPVSLEVAQLGACVHLAPERGELEVLVAALEDPVRLAVPELEDPRLIVSVGGAADIPALVLGALFPQARVLSLAPEALGAGDPPAGLEAAEVIDYLRVDCGAATAATLEALAPWADRVACICAVPPDAAGAVEVMGALARLGFRTEMLEGLRARGLRARTLSA